MVKKPPAHVSATSAGGLYYASLWSENFVQQHLVIGNIIQELAVQASSRDLIHGDSQCILQVGGKSAHLQITNGAIVDAQINVTICVCITSGAGAEQIDTFCPIPGSHNFSNFLSRLPHICLSLSYIILLFYHNYVKQHRKNQRKNCWISSTAPPMARSPVPIANEPEKTI